jgi:hypothetical protein
MKDDTFVTLLNSGTTAWTQVSGSYPTLQVGTAAAGSTTPQILHPVNRTIYQVGDSFSTNGLLIAAVYDNGYTVVLSDYTYTPSGALTTADRGVTVTGSYLDATYTFTITIAVYPTLDVYLDGTASTNGDGTASSPFNSLASAVALAGKTGGDVIITGTVTISSGGNYYDSITYRRGDNFTGTMFYINAANNSYGVAYVTFTSATFEGGGVGTVFQVAQGRLRLRGNVTIQNQNSVIEKWSPVTAVEVMRGGQLEINYATIKANVAVRLDSEITASDDTFILENYGKITLDGEIVLDYNTYVTVKDSTLPCALTIRTLCADEGAVFLKGSTGTSEKVNYVYPLELFAGATANTMTWQNVRVVYLGGSSNGDGTSSNPYSTIASAASDVENNGGYIAVIGTVNIANNSHNRDVLIKRGTGFTGTMIQTNAGGGTAQLHDLVIDGGGVGTIFSCNASDSTLLLDSNVMLLNCVTAVDASNGNVAINSAYINASQYSVYMGASSGTFTLTPTAGTEIIGTVYLASGKWITVTGTQRLTVLTGTITVLCATTAPNTRIAIREGMTFNLAERNKIVYQPGAGMSVSLGESNYAIVLKT